MAILFDNQITALGNLVSAGRNKASTWMMPVSSPSVPRRPFQMLPDQGQFWQLVRNIQCTEGVNEMT
jgi:hypothetical protein